MKKVIAIFTLTAILAAFSGCSAKRGDSEKEYEDLGPVYYKNSTEGDSFLTGLDGNKIKVSDLKYILDKNHKQTAVLDENNFGFARCEGLAYAFKPSVYFDELRDPEKFTEGEYTSERQEPSTEYFRVNVGDKFGGLTVKSAKCNIGVSIMDGTESLGIQQGEIEFNGEATLTGLLNIRSKLGASYGDYEIEMLFFAEPENGIPLSLDYANRPEYNSEIFHDADRHHMVYTDSPQLNIGKLSEYPELDFGGATYGDVIRAEITVTGLRLIGQVGASGCFAYAKLVDIRRL